jgi:hypothetical protein
VAMAAEVAVAMAAEVAVAMAAEVAVAMAAEVAVAMAAEVAVAMAAEVAVATAMSMVAKDAMAVTTVEEVPGAIETAEATLDMVETEGAVVMAPATQIVAAATTTSRHTVFKPAGSLFFDVFWRRHIRWVN